MFTEKQANAILDMRLYKLIGLEIEALEAEHAQTLKNIAAYEDILTNYRSMAKVIMKDLDRLKKEVQSVSAVSAGNQVLLEVQASYTAEPDNAVLFTAHTLYRIGSEGMELKNEVTNNSGLETIARVGQSFRLPAAFDTLSWYGKGPWETYADRKDAALIGLYTSSVAEQHVPFVVPCECGGHEDTRFAVLSDGTHTVQIVGSDDFHFSALPYSMAEYRKAAYKEELPEQTTGTWLILDAAHAGLGGDTGWTKNIHPEYRVCKGRYSYTFRFHFA